MFSLFYQFRSQGARDSLNEKEADNSRFRVMEAESQRLVTQLEQVRRQLTDAEVIQFCLIIFLSCTYDF